MNRLNPLTLLSSATVHHLESLMQRMSKEILSSGKIAEFAKFAGGKRRKSPDLISLYERSESLGRGPTESLRAL